MATLNLSANGPSINKSYTSVVNSSAPSGPAASSSTYGQWAIFSVAAPLVSAFQGDAGKESTLKVQSTGEGELVDMIDEFSDGRIQFAFLKIKDPNTGLPKFALIGWCGEGVPERTKGYFSSHQAAVAKVLHGYHVQISARSDRDLTPESIIQKVSDASGAKYGGGASATPSSSGPPPPVAKKPVFTPTASSANRGFNPLASRRAAPTGPVDDDGWGEDAPQVSRTQLEKVDAAYKPTKVDMRALTSQQSATTSTPSSGSNDRPDVVRGAYQPVGKVDIAAIRRQAQESGSAKDDRPSVVKGAYEPVGKVDIAAIRARAQAPNASPAPVVDAVNASRAGDDDAEQEAPKSLAERSSAFQGPGRLAELPKPKVANKFGAGSSSYTGTKPLNPGTFGLHGAAPAAGPGLGTAGRSFAESAAVKSPAQLWAEKKAAAGGSVAPVPPPSAQPVTAQASGGWKSGYEGKKWGAVETSKTGASAASIEREQTGQDNATRELPSAQEPPALNASTKPGFGGVAMPGMPIRPKAEDEAPALPPPPPQPPRSPTPEPEEEEEEIRVAVPVARGPEPEVQDAHEEQVRPPPALPTASLAKEASHEQPDDDEPDVGPDPARQAAEGAAATTFGQEATSSAPGGAGPIARAEYDYVAAEDNEISMADGEIVTDIDMVDDDWWLVTGASGARGLVPSNYLTVIEGHGTADGATSHAPIPTVNEPVHEPEPTHAGDGVTAVSLYDYEAAEDNELSFPEGVRITNIEFPDEDWWSGEYNHVQGLFPATYVQLEQ